MISKTEFIDIIYHWDPRFSAAMLDDAYDRLQHTKIKRYIVGIVNSEQHRFHFEQLSDKDLITIITGHIKEYKNTPDYNLPRILIISLKTNRVYKDPTEWGFFVDRSE